MKTKLITVFLILNILCINLTARYYNPKIGRFITADSVTSDGGADLQGLNRYSYCQNNPVKYVDPSGHAGEEADKTYVHIEPPTLYNDKELRANFNTPEYSKYASEQFDKEYNKIQFQQKLSEYRTNAINLMAFLGPEGALLSASLHVVVNDDIKTGLMIAGGTLAFKYLSNYAKGYTTFLNPDKANVIYRYSNEDIAQFKINRAGYQLNVKEGKIFNSGGYELKRKLLYDYVITENEEFFAARIGSFGHRRLAATEDIIASGGLEVLDDGTVVISNWSGTFIPGKKQLIQGTKYLTDRGIEKVRIKEFKFD